VKCSVNCIAFDKTFDPNCARRWPKRAEFKIILEPAVFRFVGHSFEIGTDVAQFHGGDPISVLDGIRQKFRARQSQ